MVDFAFSSTDTKSERFRFSVESPSATDGVDAEILESGTATKNQFRPRLCSPQRNEPVLEAANFTFLRGWAKIAKMGRRLRCSSVTYRLRYAPSSRLAGGPF
jgi:hypothetical protein